MRLSLRREGRPGQRVVVFHSLPSRNRRVNVVLNLTPFPVSFFQTVALMAPNRTSCIGLSFGIYNRADMAPTTSYHVSNLSTTVAKKAFGRVGVSDKVSHGCAVTCFFVSEVVVCLSRNFLWFKVSNPLRQPRARARASWNQRGRIVLLRL